MANSAKSGMSADDSPERAASGTPPSGEVKAALEKILASDELGASPRLQAFLNYVVTEVLEGRGQDIHGKTIAQDVYGKSLAEDSDTENVVRVDARRLRQRLGDYYAQSGLDDPVRIHIDLGGYAPRFEKTASAMEPPYPKMRMSIPMVATGAVAAVVMGGLAIVIVDLMPSAPHSAPSTDADPSEIVERQAILEKSAASLQAVNLAEQARGLIFPIFDVERQKLATDMFRRAIALDDYYPGGYAGAAQTLATLMLLFPDGPERDAFQSEAERMAERALTLDPSDAWTQSAAAWLAFASWDYDRARRFSTRARALSPEDGNVLDFYALIALFSGRFEDARDAADPLRKRTAPNQRLANRNIYGAANFHLGNYAETIASFEAAADLGDPVSAPSLTYLAASYHAIGDTRIAQQKASELKKAWPDFPVDLVLYRFYRSEEHAEDVINRLVSVGWKPTDR